MFGVLSLRAIIFLWGWRKSPREVVRSPFESIIKMAFFADTKECPVALILATINRTLRSYFQAIIYAEYVLRWLPKGTHNWRHFRKPAELGRCLRSTGVELRNITGMHYRPRMGEWQLTPKIEVNYLAYAVRP